MTPAPTRPQSGFGERHGRVAAAKRMGTTPVTTTGRMNMPRYGYASDLLPDGEVLVAGGYPKRVLSTAELYDPTTRRWTLTGNMNEPRVRATATLLADGLLPARQADHPTAVAQGKLLHAKVMERARQRAAERRKPLRGSAGCQDADYDGDGDCDQDDFAMFQRCYSGPGHIQTDTDCLALPVIQ